MHGAGRNENSEQGAARRAIPADHLLAARRPALPLQAIPCRDALLAVDDRLALRGVARQRQPFIAARFSALLEPGELLRIDADQSARARGRRRRERQLVAYPVAVAWHHVAYALPLQRLAFSRQGRPGRQLRQIDRAPLGQQAGAADQTAVLQAKECPVRAVIDLDLSARAIFQGTEHDDRDAAFMRDPEVTVPRIGREGIRRASVARGVLLQRLQERARAARVARDCRQRSSKKDAHKTKSLGVRQGFFEDPQLRGYRVVVGATGVFVVLSLFVTAATAITPTTANVISAAVLSAAPPAAAPPGPITVPVAPVCATWIAGT